MIQMMGYYDMHCHLLPGIDDGSQSMEESIEALKRSYNQGIRTVVCTPHFWQADEMASPKSTNEVLLKQLQEAVHENGMEDMTLVLGNELFWPGGIPEALEEKRASTIGNTNYVLVEFAEGEDFREIRECVRQLSMEGYRVILAHVERFDALYKEEYNQRELLSLGVLFQMNTSVFKGFLTDARTRYWRKKCVEGMIDVIGTDSHGMHYRPPEYKQAAEWIQKHLSPGKAKRILEGNPKAILEGRMI